MVLEVIVLAAGINPVGDLHENYLRVSQSNPAIQIAEAPTSLKYAQGHIKKGEYGKAAGVLLPHQNSKDVETRYLLGKALFLKSDALPLGHASFDKQDYHRAIPHLKFVVETDTDSERRQEARYMLGVALSYTSNQLDKQQALTRKAKAMDHLLELANNKSAKPDFREGALCYAHSILNFNPDLEKKYGPSERLLDRLHKEFPSSKKTCE